MVHGAGLTPWQVQLVVERTRSDLCAVIGVGQLATLCGLSRGYFSKAFKVSMGVPPHRWLVEERLRRAEALLEATDERISVIALSCGFSDQSHFTRVFRRRVGASPAAWRRRRRAGC